MRPRVDWAGSPSEEEQIQNAKDIVEFQHYFAALLIDRMREAP